MKSIVQFCVIIIAIFQINFGTTFSEHTTKSLGDGYICTYREVPESLIQNNKTKKDGFGYVVNNNKNVEIITIHGSIQTDHPLIRELVESSIFQRLKKINQYGVYEYIKNPIGTNNSHVEYTRYQHSLGVLVIIARYYDKEGPELLKAIISGLLHDLSHTPFSHSTDLLLAGGFLGESYQDKTLSSFMKRHGIAKILLKYGLRVEDILPENHPIQDQKSPALCADRIEYNLYACYKEGHLNYAERKKILEHLHFQNDQWYFDNEEVALLFAKISIWNSEHRWGCPDSYMTGLCFSDALVRMLRLKLITKEQFDYILGDDEIWQILEESNDEAICKLLDQIKNPSYYFYLVPINGVIITDASCIKGYCKFRGCDPLVGKDANNCSHLTDINANFKELFDAKKAKTSKGFQIKSNQVEIIRLTAKGAQIVDSYGVVTIPK